MEAIIFIGIQASGKSTFYQQNFFRSHMHISLDMLKTRNRENIFIDSCIRAKQSFVIDNTNPSIEDRKKYIDILKEEKFKIIGYYFQSNINDSIKRNSNRVGKECIPYKGILGTYNKIKVPTYSEGFDELYYVSIGEDNNFIVKEWEDEL